MKKILIGLLLFSAVVMLTACDNEIAADRTGNTDSGQPVAADRLEVYYFHRTARCSSCTAVEKYVREVVDGRFSGEAASGLIDFRSINVDLPENKEIAKKFQATGSSLYLNQVRGGQDNIEFYADVWRQFGNETALKDNLEAKIRSLTQF